MKSNYSKPNRLEDVLTLIQILALDSTCASASETYLQTNKPALGTPSSANKWVEIAEEHKEFFYCKTGMIELTARRASGGGCATSVLSTTEVSILCELAVKLHDSWADRHDRDRQRNLTWIPVVGAFVVALAAAPIGNAIGERIKGPKETVVVLKDQSVATHNSGYAAMPSSNPAFTSPPTNPPPLPQPQTKPAPQ